MAVALCDTDKDLLYPNVALFSKLLERESNKLKIPMAHFTAVCFCKKKKNIIPHLHPNIPQEAQGSTLRLCMSINTVNI